MKRLLNTLFVTTQKAYLSKNGESVLVRADGRVRTQVPMLGLDGIVCFGQVGVSPALMGLCGQRGVAITFMSNHGRFLGRVVGPVTGNVLLRREQYRRADREEAALVVARAVVAAKIVNARTVLLRALRDHAGSVPHEALLGAADRLRQLVRELERRENLEACRGLEGAAAQTYFGVFDGLIVQQREAFGFTGRTRRPPLDGVNALLSFVYTLLVHDIQGALEGVGLDPAVGFLHRDRPGRPGLALDLLEEFRPWLADRLVLSLINLQQVSADDLQLSETGGVSLTDVGRRTVLVAYQKRKRDEVIHPFLRERMAVGLLPHVQALLLARHLRGDLDGYPPFVWK